MADVKWIKLKVGMFDGMSFKKIKRAKIGGESFRDKLTAVWFELMDFAGRCNHDGAFISPREIPFHELSDIATMIDRDEEELRLCMTFFINEGMVSVIDDVYMLSNWAEYQNTEGLEKIREQNRLRQKAWYDRQKALPNAKPNVSITQSNATDIDIEEDKDKERDKKSVRETTHTLFKRLAPDYVLSENLQEKMTEWFKYKTERKEPYKEQGMKALLRKVENNASAYGDQAVIGLIEESMSNGWKGIIFDRLEQQKYKPMKQSNYTDAIKSRVSDVDNW